MARCVLFGFIFCSTLYTLSKFISGLQQMTVLSRTKRILLWNIAVATFIQSIFGTLILCILTIKDGVSEGILCDLDGYITPTCTFVILNHFAVLNLLQSHERTSIEENLKYILLFCWGFPMIFLSLPFVGIGKFITHGDNAFCCLNWRSTNIYDKSYFISLFGFAFLLPSIIIIKSKLTQDKSVLKYCKDELTWKISIVFLLLWMPFGVVALCGLSGFKVSETVELVVLIPGLASFAIAPFGMSRQLSLF